MNLSYILSGTQELCVHLDIFDWFGNVLADVYFIRTLWSTLRLQSIFLAVLYVHCWNLWHERDETASSFYNGPMWIYMSSEFE